MRYAVPPLAALFAARMSLLSLQGVHGGYGGANGQAFQRERLAYAYTRNLMHGTASMSVALEKLFASVVRG